MLTNIRIDGFKSLEKFRLNFNSGPNVLIGPNGAGKSNICQAVALVGALANNELVEFVLSLGGAENIFKVGDEFSKKRRDFEVVASGIVDGDPTTDQEIPLKYSYEALVSLSDELKIDRESLRILRQNEDGKYRVAISVIRNRRNKVKVRFSEEEFSGPMQNFLKQEKMNTFELDFQNNFTDSIWEFFPSFMYFVHIVSKDLRMLKVFNIDPHVAKRSSDILEPLSMLTDGKRLSNAIYDLNKKNPEALEELDEFMKGVMPRYKKLQPESSGDGLTRSFSVTDIDGCKFPARSLSDGTVKTIAFLVGMLECDTGSIVIEEPENYLHPWACQALIDFIRESFTDRSCIVTTHSESLLNSIHPREIIVCTNKTGYTKAERISNVKLLEKTIADSGFGCGYHYLSGSLGGTPL